MLKAAIHVYPGPGTHRGLAGQELGGRKIEPMSLGMNRDMAPKH